MSSPVTSHTAAPARRLLQLALAGLAAAVIAACGGGGVGAGGTGATASGTVNGFGSVIVNGVRYDDSAATVSSDDNSDDSTDDNKLRIGMQVGIETDDSCAIDATACVARAFVHDTALAGDISAVNLTAGSGTITVLGQTVNIGATTAVYPAGSSLTTHQVVKIHGRRTATGAFNATYVEVKAADVATLIINKPKFQFRLTGLLNKTAGTVAGQPVNLAGVSVSGIADGALVRVRITPAASPAPTGGWVVARIEARGDKAKALKNRLRVEVQGLVSDVASTAQGTTFNIDGVPVLVPSGLQLNGVTLVNDAFVEVKGAINANGVLVVTKIEVGSDESEREFHVNASEIPDASVDTTLNRFTVSKSRTDDLVVEYTDGQPVLVGITDSIFATAFTGTLEIKGTINPTTGHLVATRIKRDN